MSSDDSSSSVVPVIKSHHKKGSNDAQVKRTLKYLAICHNPTTFRSIVKNAPDAVIKAICNAVYNVACGEVELSDKQKSLFGQHRPLVSKILHPKKSIAEKRRIIGSQKGGFIIPALIGAAISALGNLLFNH